ncbi:CYTH domain-containing protein [Novosphingobium aquimarinum]|uniref:CYTH domain-containing protein n=1 Tax=Novosphingobium aquimarinum TaxID=2682494 RepID=UPI0012EB5F9C|nr:CYTH domain-containing protein [Novosphingobium aquimarinum]
MGQEIERKFLVRGTGWRALADAGRSIRQAYLARGTAEIRVRILDDREARLTVKSGKPGLERQEFEYAIPLADAEAMLALRTGDVIAKRRHRLPAGNGLTWEIDVFGEAQHGFVLAEIELTDKHAAFAKPDWLGDEVTGDPRYSNAALALTRRS